MKIAFCKLRVTSNLFDAWKTIRAISSASGPTIDPARLHSLEQKYCEENEMGENLRAELLQDLRGEYETNCIDSVNMLPNILQYIQRVVD